MSGLLGLPGRGGRDGEGRGSGEGRGYGTVEGVLDRNVVKMADARELRLRIKALIKVL